MKTLIHWRETAKELPCLPEAICLVGFPDSPLVFSALWRLVPGVFLGTVKGDIFSPSRWAYSDPQQSDLEQVDLVLGNRMAGNPNVRN